MLVLGGEGCVGGGTGGRTYTCIRGGGGGPGGRRNCTCLKKGNKCLQKNVGKNCLHW